MAYQLRAGAADRETVDHVLGFHVDFCPVARTIGGCVEISTSLEMAD